MATDGERFVDLLHKEHILRETDIVIADDKGVIALAGVIGGLNSCIDEKTTSIILEVAHFDPVAVRRTSMHLGVRTDAVMRYEKNMSILHTYSA
jgi:phenylalanyl-tRNA synthetase beta chain